MVKGRFAIKVVPNYVKAILRKMLKIKKSHLKKGAWIVVMVIMIIYFTFHTMVGNRGLLSLITLKKELIEKQETLIQMNIKMKSLENKVQGLYEESLNKDLLEEEAKKNLGYIHKDETVIYDESK